MAFSLDSLRVFVRVAELRSFTQAAAQMGMPKARASAHVQRLEAEMGVRLLQRSTRVVRPTPEGEQLLARSHDLLAAAEELGALFQAGPALRGRVRVELPAFVARELVIPRLPELFARHPQLQLEVCASDRRSAALREGLDVVLRIGPAAEPGLVGRRLGLSVMTNCASPAYLHRYGTPRSLDDLRSHLLVHYATDPAPVFEYLDGATYRELPMRSALTVDSFESYEAACIAGLGIAQLPRAGLSRHADRLVELLPGFTARPSPITLLHTHGRAVPRRVRAVMTWLMEALAPIAGALERPR